MRVFMNVSVLLVGAMLAAGCPKSAGKPAKGADTGTAEEAAPVKTMERAAETAKTPARPRPRDHLQVVSMGFDIEQNKCLTGPGQTPVAELTEHSGIGSSFMTGMIHGVACSLDNEGKWHCTPFQREPEGPTSGHAGLWRKDETTLGVDADIDIDGKHYEAEDELVLEEGQVKVLVLPDRIKPRFIYVFLVTPCQGK